MQNCVPNPLDKHLFVIYNIKRTFVRDKRNFTLPFLRKKAKAHTRWADCFKMRINEVFKERIEFDERNDSEL